MTSITDPPDHPWSRPVDTLAGVGPERAQLLARLGLQTAADLLQHRPRRYEDRRTFRPLANLSAGEFCLCRGKVIAKGKKRLRARGQSVFELLLEDGSARLRCRWWNLPFMERYFAVGDEVVAYGKVLPSRPLTIDHPETEVLSGAEEPSVHLNRIVPVYPLTEGLSQRWLRSLLFRALDPLLRAGAPPGWTRLDEAAAALGYPSRAEAIRALHSPESLAHAERARARLALEEMTELQARLLQRRRNFEARATAIRCVGDNRLIRPFLARLGFRLTAAQTAVLREIRSDFGGPHPMRRLLQGDVGAGKTVVAACAALMAVESGWDAALMAPTELLAEQHFAVLARWLEPIGVGVALRTGARTEPPGFSGPGVHIGTHALIEPSFAPDNLGLVIIDEQHRFGVAQREALVRKGRYPHLLVMTATPIPRTLGLTLYGDLDISVIRDKPPGRGRLKTYLRTPEALPKVWEFIRQELTEGRQAFVICPLVEASSRTALKAVSEQFRVVQKALAPFETGLLHGRLSSDRKEVVMAAFRNCEIHALVATSLVEVGVDVPNATIMLVQNAEAFGLAQLHQLRGRIGRGPHASHCILLAPDDPAARQRLGILAETNDGFRIAEHDLKLRGPGEFLGADQSGMPRFRFFQFEQDVERVDQARRLAPVLVPSP